MRNLNRCMVGMALKGAIAAVLCVGGLIVSAQEVWRACNSIPTDFGGARRNHACATVNGFIYTIGGAPQLDGYESVIFAKVKPDGALSEWQPTTPLPKKLNECVAIADKDRIYVLSGFDEKGPVDTVYFATVSANGELSEWKETSHLPKNKHRGAPVVCKGNMYYFGGFASREAWVAKINEDGSLGEWKDEKKLKLPTGMGRAQVFNDYIFVFGGNTQYMLETMKADVYRTKVQDDGTLSAWERLADLPFPNSDFASVIVNGKIYILGGGGDDGNKVLSGTVDDKGNIEKWAEEGKLVLPYKLCSSDAVYVNGWIYLIGGFAGNCITRNIIAIQVGK